MSLMDAWKKWEIEMEKRRIEAYYETQRKILELHKSMWDTNDKKNSDMLTIHNIHKINGKMIYDPRMSIYKIETFDTAYKFHLFNPKMEAYQVMLSREVGYKMNTYELWYWNKKGHAIQSFLTKEDIDTPEKMLEKIQKILQQ